MKPRQWSGLLVAMVLLLLDSSSTASANELWGSCDNCANSARQLAIAIPADRLGISRVNIYDRQTQVLMAFDVHINFEPEFRAWSRFALPAPATARAQSELAEILSARDWLMSFDALTLEADSSVPSVQDFLLARGALDATVAVELTATHFGANFWSRLANSLIVVARPAAQLVLSRSFNSPKFRVRFQDGSQVLVHIELVANAPAGAHIVLVPDSARLADGTLLPTDREDLDDFVLQTRDPATAVALSHWIRTISRRPFRSSIRHEFQRGYTYLFQCDDSGCVLTAVPDKGQ